MRATGVGLALLLLISVLPIIAYLLFTSVYPTLADGSFGSFTLQKYWDIFTSPHALANARNTFVYAFGSAVVALFFGTIQAWIAERTDTPFRSLLYISSILSLGIPYVLYTVSWVLLLGHSGPVNQFLRFITGATESVFNVYSMTGLILVEGLLWTPMAFLLLTAVFKNADPSLEEASLISGASIFSTLRLITLRLARPAVLAVSLLVFIKSVESFEVPAIIGMPGKLYVMTTDIYFAIYGNIPADYASASAFSVLLVIFVSVLLVLYTRLSGDAHRYQTVAGKGFRPRIIPLGKWKPVVTALLLINVFIVLILPVSVLLWASLLPYYQAFGLKMLPLLTFENFTVVLNSSSFRETISNTLILGISTATLVTFGGSLLGWFIARRKRFHWLLDQLASVPLAFPAIVMGIAFLNIFLTAPYDVYGTVIALVIASTIALIPYGVRYSTVGIMQIHRELEEASMASGAGQLRSFFEITIPLAKPALISCWLLVFLLSVRAVSMVLVLTGPENQVVSVAIFDLWNDGQIGELAALGVIWTFAMSLLTASFFFLARKYGLPLT